jgi:hypothetical protein
MSTLRQTAAGVGCVLCSGDRISSLHTVTPFCPALQVQLCSLRLRWHVSITSLIQLCILSWAELLCNWVSRSVLALRPSVTHGQILAVVRQLRDWCHGAPSLTGVWVCHVRVTVLVCEYVYLFGKFCTSESSYWPCAGVTARQKPALKVEHRHWAELSCFASDISQSLRPSWLWAPLWLLTRFLVKLDRCGVDVMGRLPWQKDGSFFFTRPLSWHKLLCNWQSVSLSVLALTPSGTHDQMLLSFNGHSRHNGIFWGGGRTD